MRRVGAFGRVFGVLVAVGIVCGPTEPTRAAERELDRSTAPGSAGEITTPAQRVFKEEEERTPLLARLSERLQGLPPFFAGTRVEARIRSYYFRKDRTTSSLSEALTLGGSLYYRSGWLADAFAIEVEGFTSQPLYAPQDRGDTNLLRPVQKGYTSLGIANARIRHSGLELVGFRQYLDLPYFNRSDSRMTPNTFESVTLSKPEGAFRFSSGYTWKIKRRTSTDFESLTEAVGLEQDRGLAHVGGVWDANEHFRAGAIVGVIPDLGVGLYSELSMMRGVSQDFEVRLDSQFTYQEAIGDDLLGDALGATWNLGLRGSMSWKRAVFRLGASVTDANSGIGALYGTSPSFVDLMQRTFNRANEKALLVSFSYDFARVGAHGLTLITNFVAAFDGEQGDAQGDAQEVDVTVDYRTTKGPLRNLWLRVRGSWLRDELLDREGTEVRIILNYALPML